MEFKNYNFKKFIFDTLKNNLKFTTLTEVQEITIPYLMKNVNVVVQSNTGSGKTLAYLLPILNKINYSNNNLQVIIFVPTKNLALQLKKLLLLFKNNNNNLKFYTLIGGNSNINEEKINSQLLIATPSKLKQLYKIGKIKLSNLSTIIFDEFDMIYELELINDINFILQKIKLIKILNLNISAFSATISQEEKVFFEKNITNVKFINLINNQNWNNPKITHYLIETKFKNKLDILYKLLQSFQVYICIIFVSKKNMLNEVFDFLIEKGYKTCKIHGELQTRERKQTLKKILNLEYNYIVSTDLLARGIDIPGISHIISMDLPNDLKYYIHRAGRTGRNNTLGNSYILFDKNNINKIDLLKKMGINFINLKWKNDNFIENNIQKNVKTEENSKTNKYNYKKQIIFNKFSNIKPGYKKKRKEKLKKITKKDKL